MPESVLELAAGPANHAVELARRGLAATALDREPAMIQYGTEKAAAAGVALDYSEGDMTAFSLGRPVDLALLLLGSAACLLTNAEVIACLQRVADALTPGGILIIELPHPRELFNIDDPTEDAWEVAQDGVRVKVRWGAESDSMDPVSQVAQVTTTLTVWEGSANRSSATAPSSGALPCRKWTRWRGPAAVWKPSHGMAGWTWMSRSMIRSRRGAWWPCSRSRLP